MKKLFVLLAVLGVLSIHGVSFADHDHGKETTKVSSEIEDPCGDELAALGVSETVVRDVEEAEDAGDAGETD
ncbi:MAG: hypothetical protein HYW47_06005 [Deltaproteobacteria bacterium]|nr:hypothetical protein [Deltaproteobacteria bacterium]